MAHIFIERAENGWVLSAYYKNTEVATVVAPSLEPPAAELVAIVAELEQHIATKEAEVLMPGTAGSEEGRPGGTR